MEIETTQVELRILTPAEGHFITQADDVPANERVISDKVYLAVNDSPDNWREINATEAEQSMAEQSGVTGNCIC